MHAAAQTRPRVRGGLYWRRMSADLTVPMGMVRMDKG